MRITKPGDKEKRKKEIDGYRLTCENCWCEFECDPDEVMTEKVYGWNPDKGETVFETFAYARCPNCGKVVGKAEIIWRDA